MTALSKLTTLLKLRPLIADVIQSMPSRFFLVAVLMIVNSIFSGIGIVFIIPLLESINLSFTEAANSEITQRIQTFFNLIDIELNLASILIIYLILISVKAFIAYASSVSSAKLQREFVSQLRKKIYQKILFSNWPSLSQQHSADFIRLTLEQVETVAYIIQQLLNLLNVLVLLIIYLLIALLISPQLTILATIFAIMLIALMYPVNRAIYRSGQNELKANTDIYRNIFEQVNNLKLIKSFRAEEQYVKKLDTSSQQLEKQQLKMIKLNSLVKFFNLLGAAVIFSGLFYIAIEQYNTPLASLILLILLFSRLMPQFSSLQSLALNLFYQAPTYQDILEKTELLDQSQESFLTTSQSINFKQRISLQNISFTYPDKAIPTINNFSCQFNHNQTSIIIGQSGIGKSTLADIVAGLIKPEKGNIYIDQTQLEDEHLSEWRKKIAYVTQHTFLFHDSIRNNLNWISESESGDRKLWEALKLVSAEQFIQALPNGLDTTIGDNGVKLSGGERQRLILARALLSKPDILILDEATNALDHETETAIKETLVKLKGKLTIIIISHHHNYDDHIDHKVILQ